MRPTIVSEAGLSTRLGQWWEGIPFITSAIVVVCGAIYLACIFVGYDSFAEICFLPSAVVHRFQVYRIFTSILFHGSLMHVMFNMLALIPLGTELERTMGSVRMLHVIMILATSNALIHLFIAFLVAHNPFWPYEHLMNECAIGFSGVLFSMIVIETTLSGVQSRSVFGLFNVPAKWYAWILLIVFQLLMTNVSLLGHLCGILSGFAYTYGLFSYLLPGSPFYSKIESSSLLVSNANVFTVVTHNDQSISFRIGFTDTMDMLRSKITDHWSDLKFSDFDISFEDIGYKKVLKSNFDLQSICNFMILKSEACLELFVTKFSDPSSSIVVSSEGSNSGSFLPNCHALDIVRHNSVEWKSLITGVGQHFSGGAADFKDSLKKYALDSGFKVMYLKNDKNRVTAMCVGDGTSRCTWKIHARAMFGNPNAFVVKKYIKDHECGYGIRDIKNPHIDCKVMKGLLVDRVRDNPEITPKDIKNQFLREYKFEPSYYQAWKGKELACEEVFGSYSDSYSKIPHYIEALKSTNPGSYVSLEYDSSTNVFGRIFVAFEACIHGFKYLRPLIFLDGTFLAGKFNGTLLAATCLDGQGEMYHLAFSIVDSENGENWKWFLEHLKHIIPEDTDVTFMSDRHHGIVSNIPVIFPRSFHGYCMYHLKNNLRTYLPKGIGGEAIVSKFQNCCYAPTHAIFQREFGELLSYVGPKVRDFLMGLPRDHWIQAYFPGRRYGRTCSSLAESFNSWIRDIKDLPIVKLIDGIRVKVMKMRSNRRDLSDNWTSRLCPKAEEVLKETIIKSRGLKGDKSSDGVFQVYSTETYTVDLNNHYCSCNMWRIMGVPCKHAVFCMLWTGVNIYEKYERCFETGFYQQSYQHAIRPISTHDLEHNCEIVPFVSPPDVKRPPGRPKKKRIPSTGALETRKTPRTCSKCDKKGFHNSRTCKFELPSSQGSDNT